MEWKRRTTLLAAVVTALLCNATAHAQDVAAATREAPRHNADHVLVGLGAVVTPAYQGSADYRTLPVPMLDVAVGPFFANLRNGIGVNAIDTGAFSLGGSVAIMPGYRRRDVPPGIDRVRVGAGARIFANIRAAGAVLTIGGTQGFAGSTRGVIADATLAYPIVASPRLMLIPSIGTTWANRRHTDRYFGVDTREARASGLPFYRARQGVKDISAGITANYRLTGRLNLTASAALSSLMGDAKDSPLVEERTQPTGFLAVSYTLGG